MKLIIPAVFLAATSLTSAAMAQAVTAQPGLPDCDRLIAYLEKNKPANPGVTVDQVRGYKTANNALLCRTNLVRLDTAYAREVQLVAGDAKADGSIVVQQAAPTIRVEQATPQVTVAQPQPAVTVNQGAPEITVRQPAPTVTVDIPQPVITVRMPKPDVNVAMAQPQVSVAQAQPTVQVVQAAKPQIEVQPSQAQVSVQQSTAQPNVTLQGGAQANVKYEREEAKVVVNQAQGQPSVTVQQAGEANVATAPAAGAAVVGAPVVAAVPATGVAAGVAAGNALTVAQVNDYDLYNARGDNLGDIERVIMGQDGVHYVIVGHGGFLGLGEKRVAVPMERIMLRDNRLVVNGMTDDQIRAMPTWDRNAKNYRELGAADRVTLGAR